MKKLTNKQIDEMFNDPKMLMWEHCNCIWFQKDKDLTDEAFKISHEINSYIPDSSQGYWDVIDIRLYKDHKDKLLKYYSHNN